MTLSISRVLADATALWRRDANLLVWVGAPFLFLPDFAMKLLLPVPTPIDAAKTSLAVAIQAQAQFVSDHLLAYLLGAAAIQFGLASLFALYADVPDVRAALRRAAALWPRFMLAAVLVEVPGMLGLFLILPGLLIFGRALVTGPVLVNEAPVSAVGAIARSIRRTRGHTLAVSSLAAITLSLQFAAAPFTQIDGWLRSLHAPNPLTLAVIDAAGAGASALAQVAGVLIAVAAYRGLASSGT